MSAPAAEDRHPGTLHHLFRIALDLGRCQGVPLEIVEEGWSVYSSDDLIVDDGHALQIDGFVIVPATRRKPFFNGEKRLSVWLVLVAEHCENHGQYFVEFSVVDVLDSPYEALAAVLSRIYHDKVLDDIFLRLDSRE